jgi:hypothetical protein
MNPGNIALSQVSLDELYPDRLKHWQNLPAQEYFVELHVQRSMAFRIFLDPDCIGYAIVSGDGVLLELEIEQREGLSRSELAERVVRMIDIRRIWCLLFDTATVALCNRRFGERATLGIACRRYKRSNFGLHRTGKSHSLRTGW